MSRVKEKSSKKKDRIYWIIIVVIILIICYFGRNTTLSSEVDLNQEVSLKRITYYVNNKWKLEENIDNKTTSQSYYPSSDTMLTVIAKEVDEDIGNDAGKDDILNSFISGLDIEDKDLISKQAEKINDYNYGVIRCYITVDSSKYEAMIYIIANSTECYSLTFAQKDMLSDDGLNLISKFVHQAKIDFINPPEQQQEQVQPETPIQTTENKIEETQNDNTEEKTTSTVTLGQKNALAKAKSYLSFSAFSYKGLIEQLEFEGFSKEEATYGVDNCNADWNEQAAKKAKSYMSHSSFSRSGLIEQLEFEGFTKEQAEYGAKSVGY